MIIKELYGSIVSKVSGLQQFAVRYLHVVYAREEVMPAASKTHSYIASSDKGGQRDMHESHVIFMVSFP